MPLLRLLAAFTMFASGCTGGDDAGNQGTPPALSAPSGLSYPDAALLVGEQATLAPQLAGTATAWSVSPGLPPGLALNPQTGEISGLLTEETEPADYVVTASNAAGATSASVTISAGISIARSDVSIGLAELTLSGVSPEAFNPRATTLIYALSGGAFSSDPAELVLTINGVAVDLAKIAIGAAELKAEVVLTDGENVISLSFVDADGVPLHHDETVWAGDNSLTVNLLNEFGGVFADPAEITVTLSDDPSIFLAAAATGGTHTFANIPTRTMLLEARSASNLYGASGAVGNEGPVTVTLLPIDFPSLVDNNDISQGLAGWKSSGTASVVPHQEQAPGGGALSAEKLPASSGDDEDRRRRHFEMNAGGPQKAPAGSAAPGSDQDIVLNTGGEGARTLTRTFIPKPGATSATIRYRFITSEVPGGYYGSKFNDYFSITIRSKKTGQAATDHKSMNSLPLSAFTASGATEWRTIALSVGGADDVVQADIVVANVGDELYDSQVIVDYIDEPADVILPTLGWNSQAGGLTLKYTLQQALTAESKIEVFWAKGANSGSKIGTPLHVEIVAAGTGAGTYSKPIGGGKLADDPDGVTHIVAVSGANVGPVADVAISYGGKANASHVSKAMTDIVKDSLRAAGQAKATITSTARNSTEQARIMFQNLTKSANISANIAGERKLYASAGDKVIDVFEQKSKHANGDLKSRDDILKDAAAIKLAMKIQIDTDPHAVSHHCGDPAQLSVVDVGASVFTANKQLFVQAAKSRVCGKCFLDETKPLFPGHNPNNAYHLEKAAQ